MKVIIDQEFKDIIPALTDEEYKGLEANVIANGCLDTLKVWGETLVDGHNRHKICETNGIPFKTEPIHFDDKASAIVWIIRNQLDRRNISDFVRFELTARQTEILKEKGRERISAAVSRANAESPKKRDSTLPTIGKVEKPETSQAAPDSPERPRVEPKHNTQEAIAESIGWSKGKVSQAKIVSDKATPEVKAKLRTGETTINREYTKITRDEKEKKREARRQENREKVSTVSKPVEIVKADAKFATIVIDPPWDWGDEKDNDQLGRARPDYGTMSLAELLELPVGDLADVDCHLYLWITNRSLPKGFALMDRWGFRYITAITWVKPSFGMGNYFRGQTEHILFGVKGSQPLKRKNVGTAFHADRGKNGHSSKPVEAYDIIESCSPGPYLEMFSRSEREDWTMWGENEQL